MTTGPPHVDPQQEGDDGGGEPPEAGGTLARRARRLDELQAELQALARRREDDAAATDGAAQTCAVQVGSVIGPPDAPDGVRPSAEGHVLRLADRDQAQGMPYF